MSFRELVEALSPDEIEKITGRRPKSGVHTQSIKPEHRANGQATVAKGEPDDGSKGYGKRRYMGDDVEVENVPELVEGTIAEENEYSFLRKHGFKKSGTLTDGGVVHTHPEHGAIIINKHGEWHHVPHGSSREDGFEGTTGNTLKNHISRLNESALEEGLVKTISRISKGWDKTKSPAEIVKRQASMTDDDVKSFHASTANAVDGSPQALQHKALSREMRRRGLAEGDVNYAKMHTQANPKYASGTKWRKSSAAVKAKPDDVGAGELGAHNGGSGHVSVKATMNQRDKLADRQEINARGHKTFAIKQTRLPRTSVRKPLPEGLEYMPGEFRELVEAHLNEISRSLASSYISGAKSDERKDRSSGIKLAQKKKWGDAKFGFDEPKVKATSEEVVSEAAVGHYHSLAEDAIDNATGFSPKHDEYHKWMTVHHKALRAHYEQQGNHRMAESHDAVAEHHASHVDDDDFHNGESHHWSGF